MNELQDDPRVAELQRLRLSLTRAAKHFDEFENQLKRSGDAGIVLRTLMKTETSFANYVAARAAGGAVLPPSVRENSLAANVTSVMSKWHAE